MPGETARRLYVGPLQWMPAKKALRATMNPDEAELTRLIHRAAAGDPCARAALLTRYDNRLRRMVMARMDRRLRSRMDVSDIVQEALVVADQRLDEYLEKCDCAFYPWLRQIAWERLIQLHRQHILADKRTITREQRWSRGWSDQSAQLLGEFLEANGTSPSNRAIRQEVVERVRIALDNLPRQDREVILLRYLEQLSFKDTAAVIGVTLAAAQSRFRRAVERLHAALVRDFSEQEPP